MNYDYTTAKEAARAARRHRRKRQERILYSSVLVLLVIFVVGLVMLLKGCSGDKLPKELQGRWRYDQNTLYEFAADGTGSLYLQDNIRYDFTCKAKDDTLYIDFKQDYVTDCEYSYFVDGYVLTITGGTGTATPGISYELTREG